MPSKRKEPIGGLIVIDLNGYTGRGPEMVSYEITATGLRVTIRGVIALALQIGDVKDRNNVSVTVT